MLRPPCLRSQWTSGSTPPPANLHLARKGRATKCFAHGHQSSNVSGAACRNHMFSHSRSCSFRHGVIVAHVEGWPRFEDTGVHVGDIGSDVHPPWEQVGLLGVDASPQDVGVSLPVNTESLRGSWHSVGVALPSFSMLGRCESHEGRACMVVSFLESSDAWLLPLERGGSHDGRTGVDVSISSSLVLRNSRSLCAKGQRNPLTQRLSSK